MKLKSCPFCGGTVEMYDEQVDANTTAYHFSCSNCDMTAYFDYLNEEESIEVWNRREPMNRIIEKLEAEMVRDKSIWEKEHDESCRGGYTAFEEAIEIVKGGV